jgi:hypothetical protein
MEAEVKPHDERWQEQGYVDRKHVPDRNEHMVRYYGRYSAARAARSANARRSKSPTLNPRARRVRARKPPGRS